MARGEGGQSGLVPGIGRRISEQEDNTELQRRMGETKPTKNFVLEAETLLTNLKSNL